MDPLVDEKYILTASASLVEVAGEDLGLYAIREAYGPTLNEGLCYEYCIKTPFSGSHPGALYIGMDGYTRLQILPYAAQKLELDREIPEVAEDALSAFCKRIQSLMEYEIREFQPDFQFDTPKIVSHKIEKLPAHKSRKYILIFFMRDEALKKYLGRIYFTLVFNK